MYVFLAQFKDMVNGLPPIVYLARNLPLGSESFLVQEIVALRCLGLKIKVFSLHATDAGVTPRDSRPEPRVGSHDPTSNFPVPAIALHFRPSLSQALLPLPLCLCPPSFRSSWYSSGYSTKTCSQRYHPRKKSRAQLPFSQKTHLIYWVRKKLK